MIRMTEQPDNVVLEILKRIQADLTVIKEDVRVIKTRQGAAELLGAIHQVEVARTGVRLDEMDSRIERIERRLQIRDEN